MPAMLVEIPESDKGVEATTPVEVKGSTHYKSMEL